MTPLARLFLLGHKHNVYHQMLPRLAANRNRPLAFPSWFSEFKDQSDG